MPHLRLKSLLRWLDDHILLVLGGFLLAFIPLYPKLPLFSPIEQYIVRVRLEDIAVAFTGIVWLVQVLRQKIKWHSIFFWAIGLYVTIGLLSVISAVFFINTVPLEAIHLGKTALHFFRYIEYFTLFFFVFSAVKTKKHIQILLTIFALTVLAAAVYGFGQKHYYWPVYSTMNREFSKGIRLVLTEHARVQSTFGGHYDLAAYLVIALPMLLALGLKTKKVLLKLGLYFIHWTGLWLLIMSASRTSFVAYLVGITLVIGLVGLQQPTWFKKIRWGTTRYLTFLLIVSVSMLSFGNDMYDRLLQVIEGYPAVNQRYHELNGQRKWLLNEYIPVTLGLKAPHLPKAERPDNAVSIDDLDPIIDSDTRPSPSRPSDVYEDIPDLVEVATVSADGTWSTVLVEKPRTFSDTALTKGLSLAIRLDTLWPQAIRGFMRNPLLGSGYATLNKEGAFHFTEADSTDNNFLRTLGETGLLGFLSFYGIIGLAMWFAIRGYKTQDQLLQAISIGYLGAAAGLLLNALYIDVFAASKVAFTFWAVTGLLISTYYLVTQNNFLDSDSTLPLAAALKRRPQTTAKKKTAPQKKSVNRQPKSSAGRKKKRKATKS